MSHDTDSLVAAVEALDRYKAVEVAAAAIVTGQFMLTPRMADAITALAQAGARWARVAAC